jgi:hypothetical protein
MDFTSKSNDRAWEELAHYAGFTAAYASVCTYTATDDVEVAWRAFADDESDSEMHECFVEGWNYGIRDARLC